MGAIEDLRYEWRLGKNLTGLLARVLIPGLPSEGEGRLTLEKKSSDRLQSELLITSREKHQGDFWRYGTEISPERGEAVRAWSSYHWRGKSKDRRTEVERGVLDVASAIYSLRRDPPETQRAMEIWSDGKIYPVVAVPLGWEIKELGKLKVPTRHISIRGRDVDGARSWKGKLDLWLAPDKAATPVVIQIERSSATVYLELVEEQVAQLDPAQWGTAGAER